MKFSYDVGEKEKHRIDFHWNQLIGTLRIKIDGKFIERGFTLMSPISLAGNNAAASTEKWNMFGSGVEVQLVQRWTFEVGEVEKHWVMIEKERAKVLAGLRPQKYRLFVDGQLTKEYEGY